MDKTRMKCNKLKILLLLLNNNSPNKFNKYKNLLIGQGNYQVILNLHRKKKINVVDLTTETKLYLN